MTTSEKLSDDLAYVRTAINRQRKMLCDALPFWAAVSIAIFLVLLAVLSDLDRAGTLSEQITDTFALAGGTAIVIMLLFQERKVRARRQATGATASPLDRSQRRKFFYQAATFLIATLIFSLMADQFSLDPEIAGHYQIILMAACLVLIGLNGLNIMLWFGLGLALGGLGTFYLDIEWSKTLLASSSALGILIGTALDRRALARRI
ncbi:MULTISPECIES: hypothetical protein [unclassified Iodidimonas]|jgi:uncharacterized membrane protein YhaH (DUF805 family)|uniref:hypothetical protein n=1 Tax=unclassified Iodidimonas TaxID=2626145 RepID=UPI0024825427|nr:MULTISPECIES: hypothetical protein [unclassified Iodidimonas]